MPDCWTALQFDNAVMLWGRYIENRLNERNDDYSPKYKLRDLLDLPFTKQEQRENAREAMLAFRAMASSPRSGVRYVH